MFVNSAQPLRCSLIYNRAESLEPEQPEPSLEPEPKGPSLEPEPLFPSFEPQPSSARSALNNIASIVLPPTRNWTVIADPAWCDTPMLNRIFLKLSVRSNRSYERFTFFCMWMTAGSPLMSQEAPSHGSKENVVARTSWQMYSRCFSKALCTRGVVFSLRTMRSETS